MSSNRLKFDTCSYKETLSQSRDALTYTLDTTKFDNCHKCRIELGSVGGTAVSHVVGNLVDLENDLRGQTRAASLCIPQQYNSPCGSTSLSCQPKVIYTDGTKSSSINTEKKHLAPCQMVRYKPVPIPPAQTIPTCSSFPSTVSYYPQARK